MPYFLVNTIDKISMLILSLNLPDQNGKVQLHWKVRSQSPFRYIFLKRLMVDFPLSFINFWPGRRHAKYCRKKQCSYKLLVVGFTYGVAWLVAPQNWSSLYFKKEGKWNFICKSAVFEILQFVDFLSVNLFFLIESFYFRFY